MLGFKERIYMRDITYCQGEGCKFKSSCERWTENLGKENYSSRMNYYSVTTTFANKKGKCDYYIPLDDAFETPSGLRNKTREKKFKCPECSHNKTKQKLTLLRCAKCSLVVGKVK